MNKILKELRNYALYLLILRSILVLDIIYSLLSPHLVVESQRTQFSLPLHLSTVLDGRPSPNCLLDSQPRSEQDIERFTKQAWCRFFLIINNCEITCVFKKDNLPPPHNMYKMCFTLQLLAEQSRQLKSPSLQR